MEMLLLPLSNIENRLPSFWENSEDEEVDCQRALADNVDAGFADAHNELRATLHHFRLCIALNFLDDDLRFRVKRRSTTWFSRFLLDQYDDERWIQMFWMT